jgi:hypothetical protein
MEEQEEFLLFRPFVYANQKLRNLVNRNWNITAISRLNPNLKFPLAGLALLCSMNYWIIGDSRSYCNNPEIHASDCISRAFIENLWELVEYYSYEQLADGAIGYIFIIQHFIRFKLSLF